MYLSSLDLRFILLYPVLFPLLGLHWPLIYIYKRFVIFLARKSGKNFGNIIDHISLELAEDFRFANVPKCTVVAAVTLNGDIKIEKLREAFTQNILEALIEDENGNNNKIRYPELKQYQQPFMGYLFWREEKNFKIDEHILERSLEWRNLKQDEIHEHLQNKPFHPERSPWEIFLFKNHNPTHSLKKNNNKINSDRSNRKSLISFRFHHSMADGQSIFKLLVEGLAQQTYSKPGTDLKPPNDFLYYLTFPLKLFLSIFTITKIAIFCWRHPLKHSTLPPVEKQIPVQVRFSEKIPLKNIKRIGKEFGVTTSAVILAKITSALRKIKPKLENLACSYVLPKANHPRTLTNHMYMVPLNISSGSNISDSDGIKLRHEELENVKKSGAGFYGDALHSFLTILFNPLRELVVRDVSSLAPIGISNLSLSRETLSTEGLSCEDFTFSVGTLLGATGLVVTIVGYEDFIRFGISADQGILSHSEMEEMARLLSDEIN